MVVEIHEYLYFQDYGAGDYLMDNSQVRRMDSKLLRSSSCCAGLQRLSTDSVGESPARSCDRNDGCDNDNERWRRVCGEACCPIFYVFKAQRAVQPDGRVRSSVSERIGREQLNSPHAFSAGIVGRENCRVRWLDGHSRSSSIKLDEIHNGQDVYDLGFCQTGRSHWSKTSPRLLLVQSVTTERRQMRFDEPDRRWKNSRTRHMA